MNAAVRQEEGRLGRPASMNMLAVLDMQRRLHSWSASDPARKFGDLWNLVIAVPTLEEAWRRLCSNKGSRTAGIDGMTRKSIEKQAGGKLAFILETHHLLKTGRFEPLPVERRMIPKPGKPEEERPLGIPVIRDRLVQMALKIVLEPIFEPDFLPTSFGFRPDRNTWNALEFLRREIESGRYRWIIEGDIKACFDRFDHHKLMLRVQSRITDRKVLRLIRAFLKAGVMIEGQRRNTPKGTPQGGIISPLLCNIALTVLDRRYAPGPGSGNTPLLKGDSPYARYADDFCVLAQEIRYRSVREEKEDLAKFLMEQLGLELSMEKTHIVRPEAGFIFLGRRITKCEDICAVTIPSLKISQLKDKLAATVRKGKGNKLDAIIDGWSNAQAPCDNAREVFQELDEWLSRIPGSPASRLFAEAKFTPRPDPSVPILYPWGTGIFSPREVGLSLDGWQDARRTARSPSAHGRAAGA